ncbi:putative mediator of RNA polymerase II transcription subunit 26 isoform X2 [Drosophila obscura]|nr:putative mediator of RNA polymerase II transcription subunit 26 isoform X2 [Drosophila obscura]
MEGNFTEGRQKRTALWLHCTRQLQRLGFRYSAAKVQKKWHNILITYNKNLTKKYVSGYVHWEFFEEMFKYLQGKKADMSQQSNPAPQPQPQQTQVQPPNQQEQQQQPLQQQQQPLQPQQQLQMQLQKPQAELGIFQATPVTPQITLQLKEGQGQGQGQPYLTPVDQVLLQEQMNLDSKSNDEFDEDSSNSLSEVREPKLEYDADQEQAAEAERTNDSSQQQLETTNGKMFDMAPSHGQALTDNIWWKDYFERKLDVEREKIDLQRSMQREQVQIQKMSMVQQERIERMKIDAINSLTGTLQKLVEAKCRRA